MRSVDINKKNYDLFLSEYVELERHLKQTTPLQLWLAAVKTFSRSIRLQLSPLKERNDPLYLIAALLCKQMDFLFPDTSSLTQHFLNWF